MPLACVRGWTHFHSAFQLRALFNSDARRFQVALHNAGAAQNNSLASSKIALYVATNVNFSCFDVGFHMSAGADGQSRITKVDATFHVPIDEKIRFAG